MVTDELDQYLIEPLLPDGGGDILSVWKTQLAPRFPHLANMARDYLAVPATTVGVERVFSLGGRIVSPQRSRLGGEVIHKVITLQNWMRSLPVQTLQ